MHHFGAVTPQLCHFTILTQPLQHFSAVNIEEKIMAEIKRATSSRRGYRAHLTKLLQSVDECLSVMTPFTANKTATLQDLHEQLERKKTLIATLEKQILESLNDDDEIESEIVQTEEIASTISTAKAKIIHRLTTSSAEAPSTDQISPATRPLSTVPEHTVREPVSLTCLPKLDFPQFSGNPFYWQSFWDNFEAAVHNSTVLTGVQKLSYLWAQLKGEVSKAGFQLTNPNYNHSVALLHERFGQPYKQIEAHMQALINIPIPNQSYSSQREFHDNIESHIVV